MAGLSMHSVVALLQDVPAAGLVRGQVGTVVADWAPGIFEVEFCVENGQTFAMTALRAEDLLPLHHEPVGQVA